MNQTKIEKIPRSAFILYQKLYLENKRKCGEVNVTSKDAIKSWHLLSKKDQDKFRTKFKLYQQSIKTSRLKNVQPYLKEKQSLKNEKEVSVSTSDIATNEIDTSANYESDSQNTNTSINFDLQNVDAMDHSQDQVLEVMSNIMQFEGEQESPRPIVNTLCEPLPPTLLTGQDFYKFIQSKESVGTSETAWKCRTYRERYPYYKAVILLKRDYLKKYVEYLENLSPRELFDYYNKMFH